ncbi:MAG: hypothetical protein OXE50_04755 [Chloroflexi bacterium]|nr:hypothetical protein [Chloroflexota bacterium]
MDESHPDDSHIDKALDVVKLTSTLASTIVGEPAVLLLSAVGNYVLNKISSSRQQQRLEGFVMDMADHVGREHIRPDVTAILEDEEKTEDFYELRDKTYERVVEERSEERRRLYGLFLLGVITCPDEPYDEKLRFLKTITELQWAHLLVLRAYTQEPDSNTNVVGGSIAGTLQKRIGDQVPHEVLPRLANDLYRLELTIDSSIGGMMTGAGAEDLRVRITPYGKRFMDFLKEGLVLTDETDLEAT